MTYPEKIAPNFLPEAQNTCGELLHSFWPPFWISENYLHSEVQNVKKIQKNQLLERRDVGEKYVGEIVCLWICMK